MSRPRSVNIYQKGKTYYIRFRKAANKPEIRKSLKTHSKKRALEYVKEVEILLSNPDYPATDIIYEIFFGESPPIKGSGPISVLDRYSAKEEDKIIMADMANQISQLENQLIDYRNRIDELEEYKEKYIALAQERESQRLIVSKNCPSLREASKKFYDTIKHLDKNGIGEHKRVVGAFIEEREDQKTSLVSSSEIIDFLEELSEDYSKPRKRFNYNRTYIGRFIRWASKKWKFISPMEFVDRKEQEQEEDIHWHEHDEVLNVINSEKDPYWQRLISTLLYTGMSAHELRGIRKKDILELNGSFYIYVTPHSLRTLKRIKRKRHIQISELLMPSIKKQLQTPGEFLFPPTVGHSTMWNRHTFSNHLNSHLPSKMTALSLRRTFGSLLLRSGKTPHEVASVMGNSIQMVEKHYAKLLAGEIDTNFVINTNIPVQELLRLAN